MAENEQVAAQNQGNINIALRPKQSLIATMADKYGIGSDQFFNVIQQTIMPGGATKEQTAAFLIVCNRYGFDPFLRQIYAFPSKGGGIVPVVSIDGWLDIMNSNPLYDGDEYAENMEDGKLVSATVIIFRKNITRPVVHTEYLVEAKRNTDPWNNMPHRMLKNRTYVQGIRRAFGVAGIMDPEEAEQLKEINVTSQSTEISRTTEVATSDLKDKISQGIQKVKDKRIAEKRSAETTPTPPVTATVAPEPDAPINVTPEPITAPQEPPQPIPELPFDEGDPIMPDPRQDELISDGDRNDFLSLMKSAPGETQTKQIAIKQKLVSLGYTNTKEIKNRHYKDLVDWAKAGKF